MNGQQREVFGNGHRGARGNSYTLSPPLKKHTFSTYFVPNKVDAFLNRSKARDQAGGS